MKPKILYPIKKSKKEILKFFEKKNLSYLIDESEKPDLGINEMVVKNPIKPELEDLYRLYQFIILNKRTTILEFGSGWSSLIFSLALNELNKKFKNKIDNLRRNDPFKLFILENSKKYLSISKKRIINHENKFKINLMENLITNISEVNMCNFNGRIATEYKYLPLCNPDFIYLDGPDQFNIKGNINNFSTKHKDMMPMVCDILKFENFLTPGTIIVTDGRGANANFLKNNFQRKWKYKYDIFYDQHIFLLDDSLIGPLNIRQVKFYNS